MRGLISKIILQSSAHNFILGSMWDPLICYGADFL